MRPGQYIAGQQYGSMYQMPNSTANGYGGVSGAAWAGHQASTGPAYGNSQPYTGQGYQGYYKTSTPTTTKTEDQSAASSNPYGGQYPHPYPAMQRHGSQSSASIAGSAYQTPVQPQSSTFGSMSARPSYGGNSLTSPTTNGQSHSGYTTSAQQYPVRSPSQGYSIQPPPTSAISPHPGVKTPISAAPASAQAADMSFRSASYSAPTAHTQGDVNGLGISGNSYPSQPPQSTSYSAYSAPGQAYRGSDLPAASTGGAQYAQ